MCVNPSWCKRFLPAVITTRSDTSCLKWRAIKAGECCLCKVTWSKSFTKVFYIYFLWLLKKYFHREKKHQDNSSPWKCKEETVQQLCRCILVLISINPECASPSSFERGWATIRYHQLPLPMKVEVWGCHSGQVQHQDLWPPPERQVHARHGGNHKGAIADTKLRMPQQNEA